MSLASDLAQALDPVALADLVGMRPDPWQAAFLRSTAPRVLLNCCRQAGKSTTAGLLAVHTAVYEPGSLTLMLSPSQRQSGELFRKAKVAYRALGRPVPAEAENALSLTLENGSRIVSLPGTEGTIRGYSGVRLLLIDEASRVGDDLYAAVRPYLAVSDGRLVALSTPHGARGWWWEAWANGGPGWERTLITAVQVPRISSAFLAEERAALGDWLFRQEYLGEFVSSIDAFFDTQSVEGAMSADVAPLFGRS